MVGREQQTATMQETLTAHRSAFVALTGRRRVGKTYLIEQVYEQHFCLTVTGIQHADTQSQINNFMYKLKKVSKIKMIGQPSNWQQVFGLLRSYLNTLSKRKKQVIFLDELPWMNTAKTGFLQMLAHLWNDYLSKEKHFILVVCGSASSWITEKIVNDKGGLHNRLTDLIHLQPFSLVETKAFFQSKNINLSTNAIIELYIVFGGIPYYLEKVKRGESSVKSVERLCFDEGAAFKNEYENLYKALFDNAAPHEAIVAALAKARNGLSRDQIIKESKIAAGGPFTRAIKELLLSGFVVEELPFGKSKRGSIYRLVDEFSIFYHRFMLRYKKPIEDYWQQQTPTQLYKAWTGYAFENICMKHLTLIKKALGIRSVYTSTASYLQQGSKTEQGFQIDFIIDRNDKTINLCECKFYDAPFRVDKKYAQDLLIRKSVFKKKTGTRKSVFTTLITNHAMLQNEHSLDCVDVSISINELF